MRFDPLLPGGSSRHGVKKLTKLTPPLVMIAALLLGGCGRGEEGAQANATVTATTKSPDGTSVLSGQGRDRMCLKGDGGEGGLITYAAQGDTNCSLRFQSANPDRLEVANDPSCTIPLSRNGDRFTLGQPSAGCAYYCGPGASLEGKSFVRMDNAEPVTDLAGDPLC